MTVNAGRFDWAIGQSPSSGVGVANGARTGGAGAKVLSVPIEPGEILTMTPSRVPAYGTDQVVEFWCKPKNLIAGFSSIVRALMRWDGANGYQVAQGFFEPLGYDAVLLVRNSEPTPIATVINSPLDSDWIGIRAGIADVALGPRIIVERNDGSGWVTIVDIVDVDNAGIIGVAGDVKLNAETLQTAGVPPSQEMLLDDFSYDDQGAPEEPPVLTFPLTESFEDGSWA